MICPNCQHDDLRVMRTERSKRRSKDAWVFDENTDTRLIMCEQCKRLYYSETSIKVHLESGRFHGQEVLVFPEEE